NTQSSWRRASGSRPVPLQMLGARSRDGDQRGAPELVVALDEAQVRRVLPDRELWTGCSPRLEDLGVWPSLGADPVEQVEDQVVDIVGHGPIFGVGRPSVYRQSSGNTKSASGACRRLTRKRNELVLVGRAEDLDRGRDHERGGAEGRDREGDERPPEAGR